MPAKGDMNDKESQDSNENECSSVLLITANVGSLFEDPIRLLGTWIAEVIKTVTKMQAEFVALHLQEVGGKTYEKSLEHVHEFITLLCESKELQDFNIIRIYMDEDFRSAEHFTALGNLYFVHKNVKDIKTWNFFTHDWELAEGKKVFSGNIETIPTKEKSKFPQHFFPECKWSRKGFMRTRWEINKTVIDLVNIHLFHDASNLAACEEFPSVYCKTRRRALVHTLERFHLDEKNGLAPYFIFGDFNFRCDTKGVINELTENLTAHRVHSLKNDNIKVHYRNSTGDNVFTIGKKEFNHADHQLTFKESWLQKFDRELEDLQEVLIEYKINFPPTYPFEEDPEMPTDYMATRCPSWCDRILMSPQTKEVIIESIDNSSYGTIGDNVCMGDHKPVYLYIRLKSTKGTYKCCNCCHCKTTINKSTTFINPAVNVEEEEILYCPYKSQVFRKVIFECKKIDKDICFNNDPYYGKRISLPSELDGIHNFLDLTELNNKNVIYPPVSINIIDSDNMNICSCSQILSANNEDIENSICPNCHNIIKKQQLEPRYRLISKRVLLSNNIIVNQIDMQYLNASLEHQEPYTPESAESHSPYPELNTTSSTSRSNCEKSEEIDLQYLNPNLSVENVSEHKNSAYNVLHYQETSIERKKKHGIVSPRQLKSRLENLQKLSKQNLNDENNDTAGVNDVENTDNICHKSTAPKKHSDCLPKCCNIH